MTSRKKTQTNQTKKTQQEAAGTFPSSDMCVFSLNLPLEWVSGARPKANQPLPEHPLWHPTLLGETRILLNFRRCTGTTAVFKGRWAPWHARFTPGERKSRTRKEDVSGYFCRGAVAVPAAHARSAPCQGWRMRPPCRSPGFAAPAQWRAKPEQRRRRRRRAVAGGKWRPRCWRRRRAALP